MSRQELADAVNATVFKQTGRTVDINAGYIGKLERGTHRWPYAHTRAALRTVLNAQTDAELGFFVIHGHANDDQPALEPVAQMAADLSPPAPPVAAADDLLRSPNLAGSTVVHVDVSAGTAVTVICEDPASSGRVAVVAGAVRVLIDTNRIDSAGNVAGGDDGPAVGDGARLYSLTARRAAAGGSR